MNTTRALVCILIVVLGGCRSATDEADLAEAKASAAKAESIANDLPVFLELEFEGEVSPERQKVADILGNLCSGLITHCQLARGNCAECLGILGATDPKWCKADCSLAYKACEIADECVDGVDEIAGESP